MKRIFIITLSCVLCSMTMCFAQTYVEVFNIKTPNGSTVPDTWKLTSPDMNLSPGQFAEMSENLFNDYNQAVLIELNTWKYNCHGYAWSVADGGDKVWMGKTDTSAETIYWTDGSYIEVPEYMASKVSYHKDGNHSAIRLSSDWYVSKWGWYGPLVRHHPDDTWDIYQPWKEKKYYVRSQCVSNYSNQIVTTNTTIYGCCILNVQNVTVTNGAKLTIVSGCEVNFSNFEVESGSELEVI